MVKYVGSRLLIIKFLFILYYFILTRFVNDFIGFIRVMFNIIFQTNLFKYFI